MLALAAALAGVSFLSLHQGEAGLAVGQGLVDWALGHRTPAAVIMGALRLPRLVLALSIGGTLGLSGACWQGFLRNPLADPGVLGLSTWAALGAVGVYYTGLFHALPLLLPAASLLGAAVATLILLAFGQCGPLVLVLAGLGLSTLGMALLALVLNLVPSPYAAYEIMHWLMGSLAQDGWPEALLALPGLGLGGLLLLGSGRGLDAMALGEEVARSMGFAPERLQLRLVCGTALVVGSGVAVSGAIGFVGLVVPHMVRSVTGGRPSFTLLPSALAGAVLLGGADVLVRIPWPVLHGAELQLGVVTSLIGTPFFLAQIWKLRTRFRGSGAP
ncbi:iron ABC transporter permease [Oecophyllibacter saccharovorans]|uniref:Iron ABC transporter permease n=1 Tax=Oecophyllibacter saccharovorans TaxID=2558360 RepID=A0A506UME6_9PROT|nr:iron ABC transporter permease [Oecophyllibacter saccharovorans]